MEPGQNPYAPPKAHVEAIEPGVGIGQRPAEVTLAVKLMWAGYLVNIVLIGLTSAIPLLLRAAASAHFRVVTVTTMIVLGVIFPAFVIVKSGQGRNWARIVYLMIALAGLVVFAREIQTLVVAKPLIASVAVCKQILAIGALHLLFLSNGRTWFARSH